jgi:hypothetical protein
LWLAVNERFYLGVVPQRGFSTVPNVDEVLGPSAAETVLPDALPGSPVSDTTDDLDAAGRRLLDEARTGSLRERMRDHLAASEAPDDLVAFRRAVGSGPPLSDVVDEERDERV